MFDQDLKESLMQAIKFTPEDLEANRNGTVTETQRAKLGKYAGFNRGITLVVYVVFIVMLIGIGAYFFVFSDTGKALMQSNSGGLPMGGIIIGVLSAIAVILFLSALRTLMRTNDMARGKVSVTEGTAKLKTYYAGYGMRSYQVKVGKTNFHVQANVFNAFVEGGSYRLFYIKIPPANMMLSIEPL